MLCGTTHKTVQRVVEAAQAGEAPDRPRARSLPKNSDAVVLIEAKVRATDGRISAKRLVPAARAEGYGGSARNFRRAVTQAKAEWRRQRRFPGRGCRFRARSCSSTGRPRTAGR